jgi:hypothetical protein
MMKWIDSWSVHETNTMQQQIPAHVLHGTSDTIVQVMAGYNNWWIKSIHLLDYKNLNKHGYQA